MDDHSLWLLGEAGIVIELLGAAYIVYGSYESRKRMAGLRTTIDGIGETVDDLVNAVRAQFNKEVFGFGALAIGLAMQFVGGFGK